ncbi:MAG TPA: DUF6519 domain-containing protein [Thermoanaerobaculia bacterium]|nr:DUF6519 domain-containing protein [Thermoanaerobaculia bacterium]
MHGEFSRLTFDPRKHTSAILQQQGRVGMDSDWNEWVEVTLHRLATETKDVIGSCGRPKYAAGFGISVTPPPGLNPQVKLSPGRLYVDGMLAELEAETGFLKQFDWPIPDRNKWTPQLFGAAPWPGLDFTTLATTRRDLFYAEVWQRHLTALNDEAERAQTLADTSNNPDWNARPEVGDLFRERALGGPDTCTRLQTVAQVKYLTITDPNVTTCEEACKALATARPKATTGTLRVDVLPTPPVASPCEGPQTGGYGGAENRTYRVQIHDPGAPGTATFKWSTENGAFMVRVDATALTAIAANSNITLLSIGNDQTVQLKQGDWVEMCGEETELGMFRNSLVQVVADPVALPDGKWRIQLSGPVVVPRAPFLRRWSGPLRTITLGNQLPLDAGSGLSVRFTGSMEPAGTDPSKVFFHDLDYWIWSARTVTRDIEPATLSHTPQQARGIERAYCCLALVTWTKGTGGEINASIAQCDNEFPPLTELSGGCCCCTVEVGDGKQSHGNFDSLLQAVEALSKSKWNQGGTWVPAVICLLPGTHQLERTVIIERDRITIRGCGRMAPLIGPPDPVSSFDLRGSHIALETLFLTAQTASAPAIRCSGWGARLEDNEIETAGAPAVLSKASGMVSHGLQIVGNRMRHSSGGLEGTGTESGLIVLESGTSGARILGNDLGPGLSHGIALRSALHQDILIAGNEIHGLQGSGIASIKSAATAEEEDDVFLAHVVLWTDESVPTRNGNEPRALPSPGRADGLRIERNTITGCVGEQAAMREGGFPQGGIVLTRLAHVQISDNRIEANGSALASAVSVPVAGIYIRDCKGLIVRDNVVTGNGPAPDGRRIDGLQGGILAEELSVVVESVDVNLGAPIQPDGWPAAAIQGNLVVAPRGPALFLSGMGPMQVTGNRLTARDVLGNTEGKKPPFAYFGAVMIVNTGFLAYLARQVLAAGFLASTAPALPGEDEQIDRWIVGGQVEFSNNQVVLDLVRGEIEVALAAVLIATGDDLGFHDNQIECTLFIDFLMVDTLLFGLTVRATGNSFTESLYFTALSLLAYGLLMCIGVHNEATHCIIVKCASPARLVPEPNLTLSCDRHNLAVW